MALGINYSDPRYQKALLAAGANPLVTQGQIRGIQSAFVTDQMRNLMTFRDQALRKKMHSDKIGLAHQRLSMQDKWFRKDYQMQKSHLKDERKALDFTTAFGAISGLYSAFEGRRRRVATEKQTAENRAHRTRMEDRQSKHYKRMENIYGV